MSGPGAPLAVYVHIPFCTVKCGYCDFNAYAGMHSLAEPYRAALLRDIESWHDVLAGRPITSVFFGGGTPTEVPADHLVDVLDALRRHTAIAPGAEISVEANPGTVNGPALARLRAGGVNRLSIGAQSFDSRELQLLDRVHSAEATRAIVREARAAGFTSLSIDLIYGLPGSSLASWRASLDAALSLAPEHLSLYALTVEEGTPLARHVDRGEVIVPDPDAVADQYLLARERLAAEGFEQYEISSWARPGHRSLHNTAYWTARDYLGIGAGAHGYIGGVRYANIMHPRAYIAGSTGDTPVIVGAPRPFGGSVEAEDPVTAMFDWLQLRLRMLDGFVPDDFTVHFGRDFGETVGPVFERAAQVGLLEPEQERLRLSERGLLLHGEICGWLWERLAGLPAIARPQ